MNAIAGKILMFVEQPFPQDCRVRKEAAMLISAGYSVSVIALGEKGQPASEVINGVHVYRAPKLELFKKTPSASDRLLHRVGRKAKSFLGYLVEYSYFTGVCFVMSLYVLLKRGFDVIHAHNPPDTLFLVALPFKLLGKKFVFDHHDLSPELYISRYRADQGFCTWLLKLAERASLALADITIATNESYKQIQIERGRKDPRTIFVVRNGPDLARLDSARPSSRLRSMNKRILCYLGSLNPQDGVDYLLRSLHHLFYELKRSDFHCVIMGSGDSLEDLRALCSELGLGSCVELTGFVPDDEMLANLAAADICVDPDPSSPLNDVSTWIKIMEYMAHGKPIVTFELKETRYSAQEAALYVPPNDEVRFAEAIARLMDEPELRQQMGKYGRRRVEEQLQWQIVGRNLLQAYGTLLSRNESLPRTAKRRELFLRGS